MLVGLWYIFFVNIPIQILSPFFNWGIWISTVGLWEFFIYSEYYTLIINDSRIPSPGDQDVGVEGCRAHSLPQILQNISIHGIILKNIYWKPAEDLMQPKLQERSPPAWVGLWEKRKRQILSPILCSFFFFFHFLTSVHWHAWAFIFDDSGNFLNSKCFIGYLLLLSLPHFCRMI